MNEKEKEIYYCPRCGKKMCKNSSKADKKQRYRCKKCNFSKTLDKEIKLSQKSKFAIQAIYELLTLNSHTQFDCLDDFFSIVRQSDFCKFDLDLLTYESSHIDFLSKRHFAIVSIDEYEKCIQVLRLDKNNKIEIK